MWWIECKLTSLRRDASQDRIDGGTGDKMRIAAFMLIASLTCHAAEKPKKEWPYCNPVDWKGASSVNINGTPYTCTSQGKWVIDQKTLNWMAKHESDRIALLEALTSSKLTHAELLEVNSGLNIADNQSYYGCPKYAAMYEYLARQWEFQTGNLPQFYHPLSAVTSCPEEYNRQMVEQLAEALRNLAK